MQIMRLKQMDKFFLVATMRNVVVTMTALMIMIIVVAHYASAQERKIVELPFGNKVTVKEGKKQGEAVVELPFGSVLYLAIWQIKKIPVCWEKPDELDRKYRMLVRNAVQGSWQ